MNSKVNGLVNLVNQKKSAGVPIDGIGSQGGLIRCFPRVLAFEPESSPLFQPICLLARPEDFWLLCKSLLALALRKVRRVSCCKALFGADL